MAISQYKTETTFDYTWFQVVQAYWNRYPNPSSTHVLTEDTIKREVRDGKLYSRRILSKTNAVPKWGERFYKNAPVKIIEDSVLDLKTKTLTTFTRNIGFKKIMKVDEIVEYSEQSDGRTLAVRRAYISSQVFGFSRAIRAFGIERFKSNCHKAASGFNYVLQHMFPNQRHIIMAATANTAAPAAAAAVGTTSTKSTQLNNMDMTLIKSDQLSTSSVSRVDAFKQATKSSFYFIKNQAIKMAQMFSVKN